MALLLLAGCGAEENAASAEQSAGGAAGDDAAVTSSGNGSTREISVGEQTWTIVANIQCSVYPGPLVHVAGHAEGDEQMEITFDYGGPTQISVHDTRTGSQWRASANSMQVNIDGKRVSGTAEFFSNGAGGLQSAEGSFDIQC